jgi:hypothetical protein
MRKLEEDDVEPNEVSELTMFDVADAVLKVLDVKVCRTVGSSFKVHRRIQKGSSFIAGLAEGSAIRLIVQKVKPASQKKMTVLNFQSM